MQFQHITLRQTQPADLEKLFEFQLDPDAGYLAAFMPEKFDDKEAYLTKYGHFLNDPSINMQTILVDGVIAGSLSKIYDGRRCRDHLLDR